MSGFLAYNENGVMQEYESWERTVVCGHCKKKYRQVVEEQVPGFRDQSYDICPYCGEANGRSMDEEYFNYRLD